MGPIAVGLDDQFLLHPAEIDCQAGDSQIYSRLWKVMALAKPEESTLELAPRLVNVDVRSSGQAEEIGLPDGPTQFAARND
jgi:hypothetical protein